jgi:outer membrane protein assembly factor BamB
MRPPCHDGVIISDGHLYWGPWMCGCQLSFYGHIGLGPTGDFDYHPPIDDSRLETLADNPAVAKPLDVADGDWPAYLRNNRRSPVTPVTIPAKVKREWAFRSPTGTTPTAPVAAGGMVFVGDQSGVVRAFDAATGQPRWQAITGGAIYFPPAITNGRAFVGSADGRVCALEAATGRPLWTFRVAPAQQRINVFEKLICRWPVAGGVVAQDGVVYAAAGMAHYDGTYVVALDAATGRVKWANDRSGTLSEKAQSGASLQGELFIEGGELRFAGGGVCHVARFDLATGKCLSEPHHEANASSRNAFYPYYPDYGRYLPLNHRLADGSTLMYAATYDGAGHWNLSRRAPGSPTPPFDPREPLTLGRQPPGGPKPLWTDAKGRRFTAFVVGPELLLAASHTGAFDPSEPQLSAITLADGTEAWSTSLDSLVVKGGLAVDAAGRVFVSLEDGRVACLAAKSE